LKFRKYIEESLQIKNGELLFTYDEPEGDSTHFGKGGFEPYISKSKKMHGITVYSIYKSKNPNTILKTLKKQTTTKMENKEYEQFLNRTSLYLSNKLLKDIDVILIPETSSFFLKDIIRFVKKRQPHIKVVFDSFYKLKPENIKIDYENYDVSDKTKAAMERIIQKSKDKGYFEMKKVPKALSHYIKNFLGLDKIKVKESYMVDQNVALLDDFLSAGTTMGNMIKLAQIYSSKKIIGITLFKK